MTNLPIIENWKQQQGGETPIGAFECILYTDAHIIGEVMKECGPYQFFNTIAGHGSVGTVLPSIVLRCSYIKQVTNVNSQLKPKTDTSKYHGGYLVDEIASITSLYLGVRIIASDITRDFDNKVNNDKGIPRAWDYRPPPVLNFSKNVPILPSIRRTSNLSDLHDMKAILNLNEKESIALIRAARLYQDALWIGESAPELCWLMLVSAVESVANSWRENTFSDTEILAENKPNIVDILKHHGGPELVDAIAKEMANLTGSTKKFLSFCLNFFPEPLHTRPKKVFQIEWTSQSWKKILTKIYNYRSQALHVGIPFPFPMC